MNNKKKLYLSVLKKFFTNNQQFCMELRKLVEAKDFEMAKRVAHTFKGITGSIGAEKLHSLSKSVEQSIMEKDTAKFDKEMQILEKELKSLFDNISANLEFVNKVENTALNIEQVKELLPQLRKQLEAKSPKAKSLVKELEEAGLISEEFNSLTTAISNYNFKQALKHFEQLNTKF